MHLRPTITPSASRNEAGKRYIVARQKNWFAYIWASWLTPLMTLGSQKTLTDDDMYLVPQGSEAASIAKLLDPFWAELYDHHADPVKNPKVRSLFMIVFRHGRFRWVLATFLNCLGVACELTVPVVLKQLLLWVAPVGTSGRADLWFDSGFGLAFLIVALQAGISIFQRTGEQLMREVIMNVRTVVIGAVYEKSLRLSGESARKHTHGAIMNLINVDSEAISMAVFFAYLLIGSPVQIIVAIGLLAQNLGGVPIVAAVAVMIVFLFLQMPMMMLAKTSRAKVLAAGDKRIAEVRETLYGMRIIKLRAWEEFFGRKANSLRMRQTDGIRDSYFAWAGFLTLAQLTPVAMPIVAFIVYSKLNGGVTADVVFPAIVLFNILIAPMLDLPQGLSYIISANVSWNRVCELLKAKESKPLEVLHSRNENANAITITDATFKWETVLVESKKDMKPTRQEKKDQKMHKKQDRKSKVDDSKDTLDVPVLVPDATLLAEESTVTLEMVPPEEEQVPDVQPLFRNLNLSFRAGELTAVVGDVGAGKSSLLAAIIGEMTRVSGKTTIFGSVAYAAQQPWIQTGSVRDNIVFQHDYDEERLQEAVRVCGLTSDVEQLSHGLDTEIGEKGVNLSGGQKARVALARAVYEKPMTDVYLLDDPISALDASVGKQVYDDCIKGSLAGKTRVLVTHHLHLLQDVSRIVVLKDGTVAEEGTFADLIAMNGLFTVMMKDYRLDEAHNKEAEIEDVLEVVEHEDEKDGKKASGTGRLIVDEEREEGAVKWATYAAYIRSAGGVKYAISVLGMFTLSQAVQILMNFWLSWWTEEKNGLGDSKYLLGYAIFGLGVAFANLASNASLFAGNYSVSKAVHARSLDNVLRAPMSWFDVTPVGRILNRFSKDIDVVDQRLWGDVLVTCLSTFQIGGTIITLAVVSPYMLLPCIPLIIVYFWVLRYYRATYRQLKRIDSTLRSPLYAQVSETMTGLATIRAYRAEDRFIERQRQLIDQSNAPYYCMYAATTWVGIRIELFACSIVLVLGLLGVTRVVSPTLLGLAFSYVVSLVQFINMFLRAFASLESNLNSIERLEEYATAIPKEAPSHLTSDPDHDVWPSRGCIEFKNLELRYPSRPDHAVIKDLSLVINPGEKIGIVGRTGSGKSTLLTALFRVVEPSLGSIIIDGQDIAQLGLSTLRNRIDIIPQDPTLFTGTIRGNLDVEGTFSDADVWQVLERINLKKYVASLPEKLEAPVVEGGDNLSVGQRQLLCLGRAILRRPRILVMDEATASVDQTADALIQESIKTHFASATVLVIAHRLNSIVEADRILVLDAGVRCEFDTPHTLLSNPSSLFSKLAHATGPANSQLLRELAAAHDLSKARTI